MKLFQRIFPLFFLVGLGGAAQAQQNCNVNTAETTPTAEFVDTGNGTATHSRTGLMWKRCAEGQSWTGSTCTGTASNATWANALKAGVNAATAGYSDWRLPNVKELESIVESKCYGPSINASIFPNTPVSSFWSASAYAFNSNFAWFVNFDIGDAFGYDKSGAPQVRLVRGGQSFDALAGAEPMQALSVSVASGSGRVGSTPPGIDCGSGCVGSFAEGSSVTLSPTAAAGNTFSGWSGACSGSGQCVVTMSAAKSVGASFKTTPFTVTTTGVTAGIISTPIATVTNRITFNSADLGTKGVVFVTAVVPAGFLSTLVGASSPLKHLAAASVTNSNTLVLAQLTLSGWQLVTNGQLIPYASGVLGDAIAAQNILSNAQTSTLTGAQFCVGYGTSAAEMSNAARMQLVATVPDPSSQAQSLLSCLVTDSLQVQRGWNLLGNSRNQSVQVSALYSDAAWVTAVWKWDAAKLQWQIHAPSMDAAALNSLLSQKDYAVLGEIKPGDGYWVQATQAASVMLPPGAPFDLTSAKLTPGWNLVTTGAASMPSALSASVGSVTSLWAWDASQSKWYFYAPSLDAGSALVDYIGGHGYLDFPSSGKGLGNGVGFWVNRP